MEGDNKSERLLLKKKKQDVHVGDATVCCSKFDPIDQITEWALPGRGSTSSKQKAMQIAGRMDEIMSRRKDRIRKWILRK